MHRSLRAFKTFIDTLLTDIKIAVTPTNQGAIALPRDSIIDQSAVIQTYNWLRAIVYLPSQWSESPILVINQYLLILGFHLLYIFALPLTKLVKILLVYLMRAKVMIWEIPKCQLKYKTEQLSVKNKTTFLSL